MTIHLVWPPVSTLRQATISRLDAEMTPTRINLEDGDTVINLEDGDTVLICLEGSDDPVMESSRFLLYRGTVGKIFMLTPAAYRRAQWPWALKLVNWLWIRLLVGKNRVLWRLKGSADAKPY